MKKSSHAPNKRTENNNAFCGLVDLLVTLLSFLAAIFLRFGGRLPKHEPEIIFIVIVYSAMLLLLFGGFEMYAVVLFRFRETLVTVALSCLYAWVITGILYGAIFRTTSHWTFLCLGTILCFIFLFIWREARYFYFYRSKNKLKLLMVERKKDDNSRVRRMKYACLSRFNAWYEQVNTDNLEDVRRFIDERFPNYDGICLMENIPMDARDMIIQAITDMDKEFYVVPGMYELNFSKVRLALFDDVMVFHINPYQMTQTQVVIKRLFDLVIGSIALVVAFIPMCLLAAAIKLTSPGPVFYKQIRLTQDKREFNIYKFRSMVPNAEALSGPVFAEKDDPRITKIGRFMRKTRLDEIPQIINILKGDMSLVGPRPERPFFAEQFAKEIGNYDQRFSVKAGLTSLSHVYGRYSTDIADRTVYDLVYIRNYSFKLDVQILLLTTRIVFLSDAAEGVQVDPYHKPPQSTQAS